MPHSHWLRHFGHVVWNIMVTARCGANVPSGQKVSTGGKGTRVPMSFQGHTPSDVTPFPQTSPKVLHF